MYRRRICKRPGGRILGDEHIHREEAYSSQHISSFRYIYINATQSNKYKYYLAKQKKKQGGTQNKTKKTLLGTRMRTDRKDGSLVSNFE